MAHFTWAIQGRRRKFRRSIPVALDGPGKPGHDTLKSMTMIVMAHFTRAIQGNRAKDCKIWLWLWMTRTRAVP